MAADTSEAGDVETNGSGPAAVQAEGLVKHYTGRGGVVEAVRGVDLRVERRRGVRLPRAERRRQVDDRADAHDAAVDHVGHARAWPASTWRASPTRRGAGSASRCRRPGSTRARPAASCSSCRARLFGMSPRSRGGARRGAARARRARGRRRPPHQGLLRRHEAPARPRLRARARAGGAVPRRADDRPGPGQPADGVGRGAAHQRARHDGVPHHAVPRGGRPAVRPAGDHRRRADRARGHARRS